MAEQIPFSIAEKILTKLGSLAVQEIGLACGVRKELEKLVNTLTTINAVLLNAEEQEEDRAVHIWVRRFKDVNYDADDLLDDFATYEVGRGGMARQVSRFFSSSNQVAFHFMMGYRIKDIRGRLDEIANDISKFNFIQRVTTSIRVENRGRETQSFVLTSEIMGRDEDKKKIIELLLQSDNEENLSVVAIVGIGGLGKTTLAQLVYNDEKVVKHFDLRLWVCVSDDFDVKILVRNIIKSGTDENVDMEQLKNKLHEKLNSKRYLLVLDDVWNDDFEKWNQLRILLKVGARGSKVVVTTRSSKVASIMAIDPPYALDGLNHDQSWGLFKNLAFGEDQQKAHPNLLKIGEEIIKMCHGVPLIIRTLGRILHSKTEESQWLSIKNNENLMHLREGNNILLVLKLSYDHLPSHLKQCFTYCALFPKDYEIERKMLIQLWMAQGYIQPLDENEHLEDVGNQYFEELLSRSMFQEVEKDDNNTIISCKMHDLVHDLAQSLVKSDIFILTDDVKNISKRIRHASFLGWSQGMKVLKGTSIRTLFMPSKDYYDYHDDSSVTSKLVNTLILNCKCLRALDLRCWSERIKLPVCLIKLGHLRYLDLSYGQFKVLPSGFTSLQNLQTLKLLRCYRLEKLPRNMRKLINLRHLEMDESNRLTYMPSRLGELTKLQTLPFLVIGNGDRRGRGGLSELKCLNNLRGSLHIKILGGALESKEANLKEKHYLQSLRLEWNHWREASSSDELVMEGLQAHPNLKELSVNGYTGVRFPSWMSSMLPSLQLLNLTNLNALEYMLENSSSAEPFFPSLETLSLSSLPNFKGWCRSWEIAGEQGPSFPSLSRLKISDCNQLTTFQRLSSPRVSKLTIKDCSRLESLQLPSLPCLSHLEIFWCDQLTTFQLLSSPHLSKLNIRSCSSLESLQLPSLPCLSHLEISRCDQLTTFQLLSSPHLSKLTIKHCSRLESLQLPSLPCLSHLEILCCDRLTTFQLLSSPHLSELNIRGCSSLESLQLPCLPCLSHLEIFWCDRLTTFQLLSSPHLSELNIRGCSSLESLQLPSLPCLSHLKISWCDQLTTFQRLSSPHLSELNIQRCSSLESLQLPSLPCLSHLEISWCDQLTTFQLLSSPHLSKLNIEHCSSLESLQLPSLPCLEELILHGVREQIVWQIILVSSSLKSLGIWEINDLVSLPDDRLQHLTSLKSLEIGGCGELMSLFQGIQHLGALEELRIYNCMQLNLSDKEDDDGGSPFQGLRSLRQLFIQEIPKLVSLPKGLQHVTTLETLSIWSCSDFTTLPDWIGSLTSLSKLEIYYCPRFKLEDQSKIAHIREIKLEY